MKRKNRKKNIRFLEKMAAMVASGAVVAAAIYGVSPYLRPAQAYARESLSGMKQIVESHGENTPYRILDITPGKATYEKNGTTYEISTGTIGYLAGGQAPIEKDLENIFRNNSSFYSYESRKNLVDEVVPTGMEDSYLHLSYQECYGGVGGSTPEEKGWILIADTQPDVDYTQSNAKDTVPVGLLEQATVSKWNGVDGVDDKTGYDFVLQQSDGSLISFSQESGEDSYEKAADGTWQLTFHNPQVTMSGYRVTGTDKDWTNYPDKTSVYRLIDGNYVFVGTVGDYRNGATGPDNTDADTSGKDTGAEEGSNSGNDNGTGNGAEDGSGSGTGNGTEGGSGSGTGNGTESGSGSGTGNGTEGGSGSGTGNGTEGGSGSGTGNGTEGSSGSGTGNGTEGGSGSGAGDSSDNGSNSGSEGNSGSGSNSSSQGTDSNASGENTASLGWYKFVEETQRTEELYVLEFSYVNHETDKQDAELLYQIKDRLPYAAQENEAAPDNLYRLTESTPAMYGTNGLPTTAANTAKAAFSYAGAGQGDYKITQITDKTGIDQADIYCVEVWNVPVYMRCCQGNDWLERYVFQSLTKQDNDSTQFKIQVDAVAVENVTYEMIQAADFIYLEDGTAALLNQRVTRQYSGEMKTEAAAALLYSAVEELKPVMLDYGIIQDTVNYKDSIYQKLASVFVKKDLEAFYLAMNQNGNLIENVLMNAGKASDEYPDKTDNNYNYVNRNIYVVNDATPLVSEDFPTNFDSDKANRGFGEVLAAIKAENTTLAEEDRIAEAVSKAMAVQYIINYSVGLVGDFRDLHILELQPTANETSDLHTRQETNHEGVVLYWQKEGQKGAGQQILRSNKQIQVNITVKSVAQFNGEYEDINSEYNMIFVGLDGQNLNLSQKNSVETTTVYNDTGLNGKVYHSGDRAANSDARYDASDITQDKKYALLDYLRAGYPVVVENNCFKQKTAKDVGAEAINTSYIATDSQMYDFLQLAVREYRDSIYTIEDLHSSALFINQLNVVRPVLENTQATENGGVSQTERTEEGKYRGTITYRIGSDRGGEDNSYGGNLEKRLYLDLNYDGVFTKEELETAYMESETAEGSQIQIDFEEVSFALVPWKLEIADTGNDCRRDSIQGFFLINGTGTSTIRILQILDDTGYETANLQFLYEKGMNSSLAYYLKGAEGLLQTEFTIETMPPAAVAEQLAVNAKYLYQWDVLVMGFGNSGNPGEVVAGAVNDYLANGGSVVVSSAAAEASTGQLGIYNGTLGQTENKTYVRLGAESGSLYRYSNLNGSMFEARTGLTAQRLNWGSISVFPYTIDSTVSFGDSTSLQAPAYLLDSGNTTDSAQAQTTVWYTLNKEEKDRNAYNVSPKDGRNNYYLYSKGNLVYVGQNDYQYLYDAAGGGQPEGAGTSECRLFVNALMAAYNAGLHGAEVEMVAGFDTNAARIESITLPYDENYAQGETGGMLDETTDVFFRYTDNNFARQKNQVLRFYYEDPAGEAVDMGGELVHATEFTSIIDTVQDHQLQAVTAEGIKPGKVYRIKAPVIALKQNNALSNARIYVVLQSTFTKSGKTCVVTSGSSVELNRAQLFLLE